MRSQPQEGVGAWLNLYADLRLSTQFSIAHFVRFRHAQIDHSIQNIYPDFSFLFLRFEVLC